METRFVLKDTTVTKYPEDVMAFVERNKGEGILFELTIHDGEVANPPPEWMRKNMLRTRLLMERSYAVFQLIEDIIKRGREKARTENLYRILSWGVRIEIENDTRSADVFHGGLSEARVAWARGCRE